jgi:polysaccharide biosynthesis/export protein
MFNRICVWSGLLIGFLLLSLMGIPQKVYAITWDNEGILNVGKPNVGKPNVGKPNAGKPNVGKLPKGTGVPQRKFVLGPEDIIEISVWGNKEFAGDLPVRPDGKVSIPLIGDVNVKGLTPTKVKNLVTQKLRKFITDASVTVFVKEINSINISIAGEVNVPGTYKVNRPITLLHLFSLSQGFTDKADLKNSYLLRKGKKMDIDFYALVRNGDISQNVSLMSNDLIFIKDNFNNRIKVAGEVMEPQVITFQDEITVLGAILIANGLTDKADLKNSFLLRKGKKMDIDFYALIKKGDISQNVSLMPNDMIFIKDNFKNRINVIGEVIEPQVITFQDGMTALDAILIAKGLTDVAKPKGTQVYRRSHNRKGEIQKIPVLLDEVIFDGDLTKNIPLKPGDIIHVPRSFF